jgi:hypothetical protein
MTFMSNQPPLCFVLMPFGRKTDPASGLDIDFDAVYAQIIAPAIVDAGMESIRADEETAGGSIQKPMFERLILCPFAIADLTSANANVFYELGVRHAVLPATTVLLFAEGGRLPFDVADLRALPYKLSDTGIPADADAARKSVATRLVEARRLANHETPAKDSPIFQLLAEFPDIKRLKTDVFRTRVDYAKQQKEQLAVARKAGADALAAFESGLGADLDAVESGVLIDLFLSYRAVKAWQRMIDLAAKMPKPVGRSVMVQEQLALALNRAGRGDEAEAVLEALLADRGANSETCGILGRVYKDRWAAARDKSPILARGLLKKAIDAYLRGFEADWRDGYPGINAVTLMEIANPPDPRRLEILPVVRYAAKRRVAGGNPDYWDHATLLEVAVLRFDEDEGTTSLSNALACVREKWEPETTLNNLRLIHDARAARGENEPAWIAEAMDALEQASQ